MELECDEGMRPSPPPPTTHQATRNAPPTLQPQHTTAAKTPTRKFTDLQKIGEGTYGVVYRAVDAADPNRPHVALKKMTIDECGEGVPATTLREVALLSSLHHENVIRLRETFLADNKKRITLVFDYHNGDLKACLDSNFKTGMPRMLVKSCALQILRALEYIHRHRVVHRDLKPQNVLIDASGRVKLADFGLSRLLLQKHQKYTNEVVTLWYRAPELLLGQSAYDASVDLWSFGCILAEMVTNRALFPANSEISCIFRIFKLLGTPCDETWPGVSQLPDFQAVFPRFLSKPLASAVSERLDADGMHLLERTVGYVPDQRLTAAAALKCPYFDELRDAPQPPSLSDCSRDAMPGGVAADAADAADIAVADMAADERLDPEVCGGAAASTSGVDGSNGKELLKRRSSSRAAAAAALKRSRQE